MIALATRGFAAALAVLAAAPAAAETYQKIPNPCQLTRGGQCIKWSPVPSPAGWKCHWSMDLKGKELKSILVSGNGPVELDATLCDLKACTAACTATAGCIAVDLMKTSMINGAWNYKGQCVCTLFGSVTSATKFQEITAPIEKVLSGWACMPLKKHVPPPVAEKQPYFEVDRPRMEQDLTRPDSPGNAGTPGLRKP